MRPVACQKVCDANKVTFGFRRHFGKCLSGEAMQSINTCEAPACHFREISYLRMGRKAGKNKLHYFKDPKFQLLPPINPKKSHISLRVLPVALMILGEKSHVETRCNGEAISWENSSFRSGNHCTITLQFLFHSHSKLNPS